MLFRSLPELREALAGFYNGEKKLSGIKANNIVVSPGGKFTCYLAVQAVVSPGDEVIIPAPYWVSYPEMVKLAGGKSVFVHANDAADFKVTAAQLREAITERTKLIILNSPSNPTGAVYTRKEMEEIMAIAIEKDIFVMSDEIYEFLSYDGVEIVSPASLSKEAQEHVIIASGFSKASSMTGWRLGTMCAPSDVANAVADLQSQTASNATTFAQYGALETFTQPEKTKAALETMMKEFDKRRLRLWEGLNAIDGISCRRAKGAFYLFPNIASFGMGSNDFCTKLLEEELVAIVPGAAFGSDENARFSYAVGMDTIEKGLERFTKFCAKMRK